MVSQKVMILLISLVLGTSDTSPERPPYYVTDLQGGKLLGPICMTIGRDDLHKYSRARSGCGLDSRLRLVAMDKSTVVMLADIEETYEPKVLTLTQSDQVNQVKDFLACGAKVQLFFTSAAVELMANLYWAVTGDKMSLETEAAGKLLYAKADVGIPLVAYTGDILEARGSLFGMLIKSEDAAAYNSGRIHPKDKTHFNRALYRGIEEKKLIAREVRRMRLCRDSSGYTWVLCHYASAAMLTDEKGKEIAAAPPAVESWSCKLDGFIEKR